jgi:nitroimidazol reductase NimA-like FMN-containing flavoprotein (pyridoxamine 5'-phosphate oxidase superfamily)
MASYYNKTERIKVRRKPRRGHYDRKTIDAILDEGLIAHVGIVDGDQPLVLPGLYARRGEQIYIHGSPLSRLLKAVGEGVPMCLTVTLLDALVLARSALHHSMNYRSVVVLSEGRLVTDPDEKLLALETIVEHIVPGRPADVRGPSAKEVKTTEVIALPINEASAKVRTGPPIDAVKDYAIPAWAGELPLRLVAGDAVPDARCATELPEYLSSYARAAG